MNNAIKPVIIGSMLLPTAQAALCAEPAKNEKAPNIIFLLADDLRYDAVGYAAKTPVTTPNIDRLAAEGTVFRNTYATTAISCCSRASILTGMYCRRHGVNDFAGELLGSALDNTYPLIMRTEGYHTGFIGKYGVGKYLPREHFDYWKGLGGQGSYYQKDDEGNPIHLTRKISGQITEFLETRDPEKPFCLSVSFKSPHTQSEKDPFPYDERYAEMYEGEVFEKAATFGDYWYMKFPEAFRRDGKWENEAHVRFINRYGDEEKYQSSVKGYYRLIAGIDEAIGKLTAELAQLGLAENTVVIFTSDNGYYLGEHGFEGKWYGHEESIRLPLVIYDPRGGGNATTVDKIALNIDLAPTLLDYAGIGRPERMQGESLRPLAEGRNPEWRGEFFYEHMMNLDKQSGGWFVYIPQSEGIAGGRYKYMRYFTDNDSANPIYEELFDLKKDPHETDNLAGKRTGMKKKMAERLEKVIKDAE